MHQRKGFGRTCLCVLCCLATISPTHAPGGEKSLPMQTRTFQLPPEFLLMGENMPEAGAVAPDPFALAAETLPRKSRFVSAKGIYEGQGIEFQKGAAAFFDPSSGSLTVRNTRQNLDLVEAFNDSIRWCPPTDIALTACIIQAPGSWLRRLAAQSVKAADQAPDLQKLLDVATAGDRSVKVLHTSLVQGRAGIPCTIESVIGHERTVKIQRDDSGLPHAQLEAQPLGFRMEAEMMMQADGYTMDINIAPQLIQSWEELRPVEKTSPSTPLGPRAQVTKFEMNRTHTAITLQSGQARLIAIWPLKAGLDAKAQDVCQGVFIMAQAVPQYWKKPPSATLLPMPKDLNQFMDHAFALPAELLDRPDIKSEDIVKLLRLDNIGLPAGSTMTLNKQGRLEVTTTPERMTEIDQRIQHLLSSGATTLNITTEIIRAPSALVRKLVRDSATQTDHSPALIKLLEVILQGKAQRLMVSHFEAISGRKARIQSQVARQSLVGPSAQSTKQIVMNAPSRATGFSLEVEPLVDANSRMADLDWRLECYGAAPVSWPELLHDPVSETSFALPRTEVPYVRMQSHNAFMDGSAKIVGVWKPVGEGGRTVEDVLEVAFMTCRIIGHVPEFVAWDAAEVNRSGPSADKEAAEMQTRIFTISPRFLSMGNLIPTNGPDPSVTGPIAAGNAASGSAALAVLKEHGIPSPKGAEIITRGAAARQLIIKNTPANLAKIDTLVDKLNRVADAPLNFTLHLIEARGDVVRKILAKRGSEDSHTAALRWLLEQVTTGKAKALATIHGVTKSGEREAVDQTQDLPVLDQVHWAKDSAPEYKKRMSATGARFAIALFPRADGQILAVQCELDYRLATPVVHEENLALKGSPPVKVSLTDLPLEKLETSFLMMSGSARILAVWQPELETQDLLHIAILEAGTLEAQ